MASLVASSVSFKSRPNCALNSSFTSKNFSPKLSVSFWRTNVPMMPALRVTCAAMRAKPETVTRVIDIVKSQLATDKPVSGETKFTDLGADSLDTVEIVMELEENFKISVDEESAATIATIQDAADLIEGLLEKAAA